MLGAAILALILVGIGFQWGAFWEADRQERREQRRAEEMWQLVKRQIAEQRATLDRAEAHARFLPENLRRQQHASKN